MEWPSRPAACGRHGEVANGRFVDLQVAEGGLGGMAGIGISLTTPMGTCEPLTFLAADKISAHTFRCAACAIHINHGIRIADIIEPMTVRAFAGAASASIVPVAIHPIGGQAEIARIASASPVIEHPILVLIRCVKVRHDVI